MNLLNSNKLKIIFFLCLFSTKAFSQSLNLKEFNQFFSAGNYLKAQAILSKINKLSINNSERTYLSGLCHSRLQEYDLAIIDFKKSIELGNKHDDIYYELGQAQYAANELRDSRESFKKSIEKKFNLIASQYYVAHISQMLDEFKAAKINFEDLIRNKEADEKIIQIGTFQLAETILSIAREDNLPISEITKLVKDQILPLLKTAKEIDSKSIAANDIEKRENDLMTEFDLDPDLLANGRKLPSKRYSGYALQRIKFDDNISLTNEENNVSQSKKESYIYETEVYGKRDFSIQKRFVLSPDIRINFLQNSDQVNPEVYQNDSAIFTFSSKNKIEHFFRTKPASMLFDLEFSKTLKDWKQKHTRQSYAQSTNYTLGEKFSYFIFGDSTVKLKYKNYKGKNESISNTTLSASADQTFALLNQNLIILFFEADFVDNYNNPTSNTNTYLTRLDYIVSEIIPQYTLGLALATTITDTLKQKAQRGTELSLNPSIDLSKDISEKMKLSINLDYTSSHSKQTDYAYQKTIFSTEFKYSF